MPKSRKRKTGKGGVSSRSTYSSKKKKSNQMTKAIVVLIIAALAVTAVLVVVLQSGGGGGRVGEEITTASGLRYIDEVVGSGETPTTGRSVTVHYTGTLENGTEFDSSVRKGQPYTFRLGVDPVIQGWVEGLSTMKAGGKRRLIIPASLAYGAAGRPPLIPPNATLLFDIELFGVN